MKKKYYEVYNEHLIQNISSRKFKKIFDQEDQDLVEMYNIYIINQYLKNHYQTTITFLNKFKKILKKTRLKLLDLNQQELQLLEERVFSNQRHIKTLATNFKMHKGEKIRIKFVKGKMFNKMKNQFILIDNGEILISNHRIIFNGTNRENIFNWNDIKSIDYHQLGFSFAYKRKKILLTIHDSESLNNTIKNFMSKINNKINNL